MKCIVLYSSIICIVFKYLYIYLNALWYISQVVDVQKVEIISNVFLL